MRTFSLPLLTALLLCLSLPASACIWDRDTLAMEKAKFPETVELIAGYFARHSSSYYQWRLEQVRAIPAGQRTAADFDDLAASYDKLGEHQKAIDTMHAKIEYFPNEGQYETHANLGTFYIHNGDLEQGVQYIGSAIEINPDAHFGREVYQKLVVEYVLKQREAGHTLPLNPFQVSPFPEPGGQGFAAFVLREQGIADDQAQQSAEIKRAIKGVQGMMRFGNFDSPILLEVLGDLLSSQMYSEKVQRLATRAYLKASYEVDDPAVATTYRNKAESAVGNQENDSLEGIEAKLKEEIAQGDAYFEQIKADEDAWIAAGKDVDAEFVRVYYQQSPEFGTPITDRFTVLSHREWLIILLPILGVLLIVLLRLSKRRQSAAS